MLEPSRGDSPLLIRALRHGWKIPAELREKIVAVLCEITSDPKARPRRRNGSAGGLSPARRLGWRSRATTSDVAGRHRTR
jgi:hypothetical protein